MAHRVHFLANCCHTCKQLHPTLECEICHMVFYCSENDRRDNWRAHSQLCRAFFKLGKAKGVARIYEQAEKTTPQEFRDLRHAVALECSKFLSRPLDSWELEIIYWPRVCNVCYKQSDNLICCNDCEFVYTCSERHFNKNHQKWCSTLKFYHEMIREVEINGIPVVADVEIAGATESMKEVFEKSSKSHVEQAFLSERLTYPLTIQRVIKNNLSQDETFVIHVIGAEMQAEVLPFDKWEKYLLHVLPRAQAIDLIFIGPDLRSVDGIPLKNEINLCQSCRNAGKRLKYELVCNTVYHEYLGNPGATTPNLITALNAGLYRLMGFQGIDTWTPTLAKMFRQPAPVLITEYTSCEMDKDLSLISAKFPAVEILEKPQENPFASVKPNLNVISDEETPVIFKNYLSMVLKIEYLEEMEKNS